MNWRTRLLILVLALIETCGTVPAAAQGTRAFVSRGIGSYRALEFDSAAGWLRRALSPPLLDGLPPSEQVQALAYLGATEHFRGRPDSAAAAFRRMLRLDPVAHPDPLVFPPEVTSLFERVRADFPVVALSAPSEGTIDRERPSYQVIVRPSVPQQVAFMVERADGRVVDTLYAGPVGDSLVVAWNGRDRSGVLLPDGGYTLTATSVVDGPRNCRVRMPVTLTSHAVDTLPTPAPLAASALLPERAGAGDAPAAFARAALLAAGALALPVMANDASSGNGRLIAGALTAAGVVALIRYRPGAPIPENAAANAIARARWQQRADKVKTENAARERSGVLRISAGAPTLIGCAQP